MDDASARRRETGGNEIDRTPADGIRCPVIGNRLERDLALDFEDVADLVEDPCEIGVRQVGCFVGEDVGWRILGIVEDGRPGRVVSLRARALGSVSWHRGRW